MKRALDVVDPRFQRTYQARNTFLSGLLGCRVVCKLECATPVRSFKGRGVDFFLKERRGEGPVACASAGNFGLALATLAAERGQRCLVFVSRGAPAVKVDRLRAVASEVIVTGDDFDAAKLAARAYCEHSDYLFVEDGAEPEIGEGAGTIAAELLTEFPDLDWIVVPVGNGSLAGGIGVWVDATAPHCRTVGVVAEGAPSMYLSWLAGTPVPCAHAQTVADGIAVREPVPEAVAQLGEVVDEMVLVDEAAIRLATNHLRKLFGAPVEGAGAVALAGLMRLRETAPLPEAVGVVVTGANAD